MLIEKLKPQCISCLVNKHLDNAPKHFSESEKRNYMQGILKIIGDADARMSAPVIVEKIYKFKESFGIFSDFRELKSQFNSYMLSLETEIENKIENSADSLKTAVLYAISGNYIDFGALDDVAIKKLDEILEGAENIPLDLGDFEAFRKQIISAKRVTYLADNCGEIVLDKLLIKQILKHNPNVKIDVIVRGADVLNDCTLIDAQQAGLSEIVSVTGNGTAIAGTCLEKISDKAKYLIDNADIIISKGQGNFETLYPSGKNIYYLFLCKCEMFAKRFGVKAFTGMFIKDNFNG